MSGRNLGTRRRRFFLHTNALRMWSLHVGCRDVMRIIMSIWLKVAPELRHLDIEAGSNHKIKSEDAVARVRDSGHM